MFSLLTNIYDRTYIYSTNIYDRTPNVYCLPVQHIYYTTSCNVGRWGQENPVPEGEVYNEAFNKIRRSVSRKLKGDNNENLILQIIIMFPIIRIF